MKTAPETILQRHPLYKSHIAPSVKKIALLEHTDKAICDLITQRLKHTKLGSNANDLCSLKYLFIKQLYNGIPCLAYAISANNLKNITTILKTFATLPRPSQKSVYMTQKTLLLKHLSTNVPLILDKLRDDIDNSTAKDSYKMAFEIPFYQNSDPYASFKVAFWNNIKSKHIATLITKSKLHTKLVTMFFSDSKVRSTIIKTFDGNNKIAIKDLTDIIIPIIHSTYERLSVVHSMHAKHNYAQLLKTLIFMKSRSWLSLLHFAINKTDIPLSVAVCKAIQLLGQKTKTRLLYLPTQEGYSLIKTFLSIGCPGFSNYILSWLSVIPKRERLDLINRCPNSVKTKLVSVLSSLINFTLFEHSIPKKDSVLHVAKDYLNKYLKHKKSMDSLLAHTRPKKVALSSLLSIMYTLRQNKFDEIVNLRRSLTPIKTKSHYTTRELIKIRELTLIGNIQILMDEKIEIRGAEISALFTNIDLFNSAIKRLIKDRNFVFSMTRHNCTCMLYASDKVSEKYLIEVFKTIAAQVKDDNKDLSQKVLQFYAKNFLSYDLPFLHNIVMRGKKEYIKGFFKIHDLSHLALFIRDSNKRTPIMLGRFLLEEKNRNVVENRTATAECVEILTKKIKAVAYTSITSFERMANEWDAFNIENNMTILINQYIKKR